MFTHSSTVSHKKINYFTCYKFSYVIDNVVLKAHSIVIPESMREEILKIIHDTGYQGFASNLVITHLKSIFARHGITSILMSDNGPPFSSKDFYSFTKSWNIERRTSSPYLSRLNEMAECTIGTVKGLLKKCDVNQSYTYLALLQLGNTPKQSGYSPSQLSMSRKLRTTLPILDNQLLSDLDNYVLKQYLPKN